MSFHPCHERRALQARILPELRAVVRRHEPVLQEWTVVDLAPGREVVILVMPPLRPCPTCWQQGRVYEPGPLGLCPVVCPECSGRGRV